jgi:hypothetical protein
MGGYPGHRDTEDTEEMEEEIKEGIKRLIL